MKTLTLVITILIAVMLLTSPPSRAQGTTMSIESLTFTNMRMPDGSRVTPVTITGSGINLSGTHNPNYAPRACEPCRRGDAEPPRIDFIADLTSVYSVHGYINGKYYDQVFLAGGPEIQALAPARVPLRWTKRLKLVVPVTMSASSISAYRTANDIGHPELAIFSINNVTLQGTATLDLHWYLSSGQSPIFEDSSLVYSFTRPQ